MKPQDTIIFVLVTHIPMLVILCLFDNSFPVLTLSIAH